jgi:signal transduction histidine kinase
MDMTNRLAIRPGSLSYRHKLMLALLLVTLLPFIAGSALYLYDFQQTKTRDWLQQYANELERATESIGNIAFSMVQKSLFLNNNLQVVQFIRQDYSADLVSYLNNVNNVTGILEALQSDHLRHEVRLYVWNESLYQNGFIVHASRLPQAVREAVLRSPDMSPVVWLEAGEDGKPDLHLYHKILDLDRELAITDLKTGFAEWSRPLGYSLPPNSFLLVYVDDRQPVSIASNGVRAETIAEAAVRYADTGRASNYRTVEAAIPILNRKAVLFLDPAPLTRQLGIAMTAAAFTALGLMAAIGLAVSSISRFLTRRLDLLMKKTALAADLGNMDSLPTIPVGGGTDELSLIDRRFSEMVERIRDYYRKIKDFEVEQKRLETEILQVHINPHFLYNSLSAIKWTYPDGRLSALIDEMVDYYRIFLNRGQSLIPVRLELQMIKAYLDIQRFAYGTDFRYDIRVEDGAAETFMLKNLIQPIVENSILHGINGMEERGRISIRARLEGNRLIVTVIDNGAGMPPKRLEKLKEETDDLPLQTAGGYGFFNVKKRIRIYYGDNCELHVRSKEGEGTAVELVLPAIADYPKAGPVSGEPGPA